MTHFKGDKKNEYEISYGINTYFKLEEKVTVAFQANNTFHITTNILSHINGNKTKKNHKPLSVSLWINPPTELMPTKAKMACQDKSVCILVFHS